MPKHEHFITRITPAFFTLEQHSWSPFCMPGTQPPTTTFTYILVMVLFLGTCVVKIWASNGARCGLGVSPAQFSPSAKRPGVALA